MLTIALIIGLALMVMQTMLIFSAGTVLDDVIEAIKDVREEIKQLRKDSTLNSMGSK